MTKKALVTGGAGFIGSNLVDLLVDVGFDVAVVDDLSTGKTKNLNPYANFHHISIQDPKLIEVFHQETPDCVFHLAAQINVRESVRNPSFDAGVNVLGSINLLECMRKTDVPKIVYASSGGAVYGEPEKNPPTETHPIAPLCPYGASKYCVEKYVELYNKLYSIEYNIMRYANVYGPRQDPLGEAGVVAIFTKLLVDGKNPQIFGDGEQSRDFCYVKDVVNATYLGFEKSGKSKIYNVGSGVSTSVNEVTRKLMQYTGSDAEPVHSDPVVGEVRHIYLDTHLIEKELGFKAETDLDEGIKKTVEWVRNG